MFCLSNCLYLGESYFSPLHKIKSLRKCWFYLHILLHLDWYLCHDLPLSTVMPFSFSYHLISSTFKTPWQYNCSLLWLDWTSLYNMPSTFEKKGRLVIIVFHWMLLITRVKCKTVVTALLFIIQLLQFSVQFWLWLTCTEII